MSDIPLSPALIWAILGIVLFLLELTTYTFILSFLGFGALIVSLTTSIDLTPLLSGQLAVFSVSSLATMLLFRRTAKKLFPGSHDAPPGYVGQLVKVTRDIPAGGEGVVTYRGSEWIAFSDHPENVPEGEDVRIILMDGIRVKVAPIKKDS